MVTWDRRSHFRMRRRDLARVVISRDVLKFTFSASGLSVVYFVSVYICAHITCEILCFRKHKYQNRNSDKMRKQTQKPNINKRYDQRCADADICTDWWFGGNGLDPIGPLIDKEYLSRVAARVETDAEKRNLGQMCHAFVCRRTEPAQTLISLELSVKIWDTVSISETIRARKSRILQALR